MDLIGHFCSMNPRLFLYNPTCEMAIANGQVSYMPPRNLAVFEHDMASFPFVFAKPKDFILVPDREGHSLAHLEEIGWEMPGLVTTPADLPTDALDDGVELHPWGWSPAVYRRFLQFMPHVSASWPKNLFYNWNPRLATLLSRETGYRLLEIVRSLYEADKRSYSLLKLPEKPIVITNEHDLSNVVQSFPLPAVIKTPWSASGRGLYRIRNVADDPAQSPWVKGMLRRQKKLYAEAWLDKVQDVSFHFWLHPRHVEYLGHNYFYTEPSGQFGGCAIGLPQNLTNNLIDPGRVAEALAQAAHLLTKGLQTMQLNHEYTGPLGIDALFFRHGEGGEVVLNPCVEANLRYTMGLANVLLKNRLHPKSTGLWRTGRFAQYAWRDFCRENSRRNPPVVESGVLKRGFLPLVSPHVEKQFGAWIRVGTP